MLINSDLRVNNVSFRVDREFFFDFKKIHSMVALIRKTIEKVDVLLFHLTPRFIMRMSTHL